MVKRKRSTIGDSAAADKAAAELFIVKLAAVLHDRAPAAAQVCCHLLPNAWVCGLGDVGALVPAGGQSRCCPGRRCQQLAYRQCNKAKLTAEPVASHQGVS